MLLHGPPGPARTRSRALTGGHGRGRRIQNSSDEESGAEEEEGALVGAKFISRWVGHSAVRRHLYQETCVAWSRSHRRRWAWVDPDTHIDFYNKVPSGRNRRRSGAIGLALVAIQRRVECWTSNLPCPFALLLSVFGSRQSLKIAILHKMGKDGDAQIRPTLPSTASSSAHGHRRPLQEASARKSRWGWRCGISGRVPGCGRPQQVRLGISHGARVPRRHSYHPVHHRLTGGDLSTRAPRQALRPPAERRRAQVHPQRC